MAVKIELKNARLNDLVIHYVGNKTADQQLFLADNIIIDDDSLVDKFNKAFLSAFNNIEEQYCFSHPSSLDYNEVYNYCIDIFEERSSFNKASRQIATHLYESSEHPKIKGGELYVAFFDDCLVDHERCAAIGIFKAEKKHTFFDVNQHETEYALYCREGIDISKMEKGCLIFNSAKEKGYVVLIIDGGKKTDDTQYWKEKFLQAMPVADQYHYTKNYLQLTKEYITEQLPHEFEVSRVEQVNLLNKSMDYFKNNEDFDEDSFKRQVFEKDNMAESFGKFKEELTDQYYAEPSFQISPTAVKKQSRIFKSVIKLDKNFHIYVHGNRELIERGFDEVNGKKYYKIFFDEEN